MEKRYPVSVHVWVTFSFKIQFQEGLVEETRGETREGPFFCILYMKTLSKCPYSKKLPLPQKFPCCAPVARIRLGSRQLNFPFFGVYRKKFCRDSVRNIFSQAHISLFLFQVSFQNFILLDKTFKSFPYMLIHLAWIHQNSIMNLQE